MLRLKTVCGSERLQRTQGKSLCTLKSRVWWWEYQEPKKHWKKPLLLVTLTHSRVKSVVCLRASQLYITHNFFNTLTYEIPFIYIYRSKGNNSETMRETFFLFCQLEKGSKELSVYVSKIKIRINTQSSTTYTDEEKSFLYIQVKIKCLSKGKIRN